MRVAPAIRAAAPGDHAAIDALLRAAFGGETEAALMLALRRDGAVLCELVACDSHRILGQVAMSAATVAGRPVAALAPLAVAQDARRQGIGAVLVRAALTHCPVDAVMVLGDPGYYGRFGFTAAAAAGLTGVPWAGHAAFQAMALRPGAALDGIVRYADAFGSLG